MERHARARGQVLPITTLSGERQMWIAATGAHVVDSAVREAATTDYRAAPVISASILPCGFAT